MKTTYIVSGLPGSGTSLMAKAISCGGMTVVHNGSGKVKLQERFKFNLPEEVMKDPSVFTKFTGNLIKLPIGRLFSIPDQNYFRVIIMLRTPEEIRRTSKQDLSDYQQRIALENAIRSLKARNNVQMTTISFRDLLSYTEHVLGYLKMAGWPIDVKKAIEIMEKNNVISRSN